MSIREVTMYTIDCDRCGADAFEDDEFVAWVSAEQALDVLRDSDWLIRDDGQWCQDCTGWDDDLDVAAPLPNDSGEPA